MPIYRYWWAVAILYLPVRLPVLRCSNVVTIALDVVGDFVDLPLWMPLTSTLPYVDYICWCRWAIAVVTIPTLVNSHVVHSTRVIRWLLRWCLLPYSLWYIVVIIHAPRWFDLRCCWRCWYPVPLCYRTITIVSTVHSLLLPDSPFCYCWNLPRCSCCCCTIWIVIVDAVLIPHSPKLPVPVTRAPLLHLRYRCCCCSLHCGTIIRWRALRLIHLLICCWWRDIEDCAIYYWHLTGVIDTTIDCQLFGAGERHCYIGHCGDGIAFTCPYVIPD